MVALAVQSGQLPQGHVVATGLFDIRKPLSWFKHSSGSGKLTKTRTIMIMPITMYRSGFASENHSTILCRVRERCGFSSPPSDLESMVAILQGTPTLPSAEG
jgi:hypothetical protein